MELEYIEKILFLEYLTGYNIPEVYSLLKLQVFDKVIETYVNNKGAKPIDDSEKHIKDSLQEAKIAMGKLQYYNVKAIPHTSDEYPEALKSIRNAPPLLFVKGNLKVGKGVAIVGSRETSNHAPVNVQKLTDAFCSAGYSIVSGLALGIDSLAHRGAISQYGHTVAVLAHSLDSIYPKENYELAAQIIDTGGALISELPFGLNRGKKSFVERNRIQAGLSDIVLPVEMGQNSGTMYTVEFGLSQGKKLFIPIYRPEVLVKKEFEGIRFLINKYQHNPKPNIRFYNTIDSLVQIINGEDTQGKLFT